MSSSAPQMLTILLDLLRNPIFQKYHRSKHHVSKADCTICEYLDHKAASTQTPTTNINDVPAQTISEVSRIFALIIGIAGYATLEKLRGTVPDAKAMKKYLMNILSVPKDQINMLLDLQATRDAIIQAFKALRDDPRINEGDPILIYYSGHGGELPPPPEWVSGYGDQRKIQYILPVDYDPPRVHGIPDRTIGALIEQIACKKGDNITVIFDSCHSGSGTRTTNQEFVPRCATLSCNVPPTLDDNIWGTRAAKVAENYAKHRLRSHVLLAACNEKELAYEVRGHGQFTRALLKTLKTVGAERLTYVAVLRQIGTLEWQNPQCEGYHRERILFNGRKPDSRPIGYRIRHDGCRYIIDAGSAHGISKGAEFTVYPSSADMTTALVVVGVDDSASIRAFDTIAISRDAMPVDIPEGSIALQTRAGEEEDLALHVPQEESLFPVFETLLTLLDGSGSHACKISLVDGTSDKAKMGITMENNKISFKILDPRVTMFGLTTIPFTVTPDVDELARILASAAHYHSHLNRTPRDNEIDSRVKVDFYRLDESVFEFDDDGYPMLFPVEPSLCQDNIIDFEVNLDAIYGIKITNDTPWDLYPNIFFFDNSDLSIEAYYTQSTAGKPYAPLQRNGGTLTAGYGSGGLVPYRYYLRDRQDVDVGFLKIFLTTKAVDMSDIAQSSPFDNERNTRRVPRHSEDIWGTVFIPVVQRRFGRVGIMGK